MTAPALPPMVSTGWLADRLADPDLRIFDCTTWLRPGIADPARPLVVPLVVESGRTAFDAAHIPGAGFLDLQGELSDPASDLRFAMPRADALVAAFARRGIGPGTRVVLYSDASMNWATRVWWMLRWAGFDDAAILDGSIVKWKAEGRPLSTEACRYPSAAPWPARERPALFVDRAGVAAAVAAGASGARATCVLNALTPAQHAGAASSNETRPGRIAGSVNVPAGDLVRADRTFRSAEELRALFAAQGATPDRRILCYCGGGIAATGDAFVLTALLGYPDVAVYDGSLQEWARDPSAPMETD